MRIISKPAGDYPSFYQPYMAQVPDDGELIKHLTIIMQHTKELALNLPEQQLLFRYLPGKWSLKEIFLHLSDCERVIIYRAMRIARADKTGLPPFDENLFTQTAKANARPIENIIQELEVFRTASIVFIDTLSHEELETEGTANGFILTPRLLVNHLYGHHKHHISAILEKYLK